MTELMRILQEPAGIEAYKLLEKAPDVFKV